MKMIEKTVLLGFHNSVYLYKQKQSFQTRDFVVTPFSTPREMLNDAEKNKYGWYVMDVNFGYSTTSDFTFAKAIREIIQTRVREGEARFFCLSESPLIVLGARGQGLPGLTKVSFEYLFSKHFNELSSGKFEDLLEMVKVTEW